ncbi:NinG protein [Vibrio phage 1.162.O._10N.261.48.E3]|nr:NinG protein [Vibrio phage 1.147.O._10N.286.49.E9]AUR91728.1 NinG protein [Vibrio phage 1.162.O._10N.261.48.E3]
MSTLKKRCPQCRKYFLTEEMMRFGAQHFCTFDHAVQYANKASTKAKGKAIKDKHERKELRKRKESLKSASEYTKEAQTAVNAYIRARDYGKACISCGRHPKAKGLKGHNIDAGHYRSRGAAGHLRFNLLNIHAQCVKCNREQSGNVVDYRIRLIEKIGVELVESLEHDNRPRKFTIEYLKRVKRIFNKRARWYKNRKGIS